MLDSLCIFLVWPCLYNRGLSTEAKRKHTRVWGHHCRNQNLNKCVCLIFRKKCLIKLNIRHTHWESTISVRCRDLFLDHFHLLLLFHTIVALDDFSFYSWQTQYTLIILFFNLFLKQSFFHVCYFALFFAKKYCCSVFITYSKFNHRPSTLPFINIMVQVVINYFSAITMK